MCFFDYLVLCLLVTNHFISLTSILKDLLLSNLELFIYYLFLEVNICFKLIWFFLQSF
ncbi:hypothetical protein VCRA213O314_480038 [Vibrio crassostreae]|nr:hypothetical protein VCRA213O314_480038 [Vibrio crassostreae]